jgi:hypothetical protein
MIENISLKDFKKLKSYNKSENKYILLKKINICEQEYEGIIYNELSMGEIKFTIDKKQSLKESILKINEYINWLSNLSKKEFFDKYFKYIKSPGIKIVQPYESFINFEQELDEEWYNSFDIHYVGFYINEKGEIGVKIYFDEYPDDDEDGKLQYIQYLEKEILGIDFNCKELDYV